MACLKGGCGLKRFSACRVGAIIISISLAWYARICHHSMYIGRASLRNKEDCSWRLHFF